MNLGRLVLAGLAATLAYYAYGFLVFGLLIAEDYAPYAEVYRHGDAITKLMPLGMAGTFIAALALTVMYARGQWGSTALAGGARLGVLVGIVMVTVHVLGNYVSLNIGGVLALEQAAAVFVQWTIVCIVVAVVYRPALSESR